MNKEPSREIKNISAYKTTIAPKPATTKNADSKTINLNDRLSKIRAKPESATKETKVTGSDTHRETGPKVAKLDLGKPASASESEQSSP